ncbi:MAG: 5-nucleotidase [Myxococcaceae bacterium]|nr:5-nucleotidase [Myxococcaceae bacterium]
MGDDASHADAAEATDLGPDASSIGVDVAVDAATDARKPSCAGEASCVRYVFVTSALYAGEDIGAAIGADGRCNSDGSLNGVHPALAGRTWQSWISDDVANTTASARLTHGTMAYRLADGTLIANDWAQLTSGSLAHAIDLDETGKTVGQDYVWTGTQAFGQATTQTCTNWSINGLTNRGSVGLASASDSSWTNAGAVFCGDGHRLYCFEK